MTAPTEAELEEATTLSMVLRDGWMAQLAAFPAPMTNQIMLNALGSMIETTFMSIPFEEPSHLLEEFDNWIKYTRGRLVDLQKERLN